MSRHRGSSSGHKVYIGNLGHDASEHEIERSFSRYGDLLSVWVARNPPGFAFVEYDDIQDAEDAVRNLDGTTCCGERIRVEISNMRNRSGGSRGYGGGGGGSYGRGPPRREFGRRRAFDPDDKCYVCSKRGHYSYDCPENKGGRRRSRSRSRSPRRRRSRSRSRSPKRSRARSHSRSRSRSRHTRSRSGSAPRRGRSSPTRDNSRSRSRSKARSASRSRSNARSASRSRSNARSASPQKEGEAPSQMRNGDDD